LAKKRSPRVALVVDDSMLVRHCVSRYLEHRGFVITTASNGLEALERLTQLKADLIVTDMQMPQMDGRQLITELQKNADHARIPIIVVTGRQLRGDVTETRATYSIHKDIDIEGQLGRALVKIFGKNAAAAAGGK
jgi:CheY-like chemotaxis protein